MRNFLILTIIGISMLTLADDYRSFTDKKGRTIKARIIHVDHDSNKVTLLLENNRKSTVLIDIFSDKDSSYIHTWEPPATEEKSVKLSLADVKEVAEKYERSWNTEDHAAVASMSLIEEGSPSSLDFQLFQHNRRAYLKKVNTGKATDYGFHISYTVIKEYNEEYSRLPGPRMFAGPSGWCLLAPDGKIKYDPIFKQHPIESICIAIKYTLADHSNASGTGAPPDYFMTSKYKIRDSLKEAGLTEYNVGLLDNREEAKNEVKRLIEWLEENGDKFDTSEPKVFYPTDLFDDLKNQLKRDKRKLRHA